MNADVYALTIVVVVLGFLGILVDFIRRVVEVKYSRIEIQFKRFFGIFGDKN